jgi:DNA-binding Lrp family transcriptional regulator
MLYCRACNDVQYCAPVDAAERVLLERLGAVTRPNVLELSRRLGVARNTAQARLDRLEAGGIIEGFGPFVDLTAAGFGVLAFTTLEIAQGAETAVLAGISRIPEALEVHKITGPGDLLCRIVARTNDHLHEVLERVLATPGIRRTSTALALATPWSSMHPSADAIAHLNPSSPEQAR